MNAPETDARLAAEVARIKRAAVKYGRRIACSLVALLIARVIVGIAVWLVAVP